MATMQVPAAGEKFYACLEAEAIAGEIDWRGPLGGKSRKVEILTIKKVFHQTAVPEGMAPTWCIWVEENETCYDCAWSEELQHWVYGGANSGMTVAK